MIRKPDPIKREQLIYTEEDSKKTFEYQWEDSEKTFEYQWENMEKTEALNLSRKEYEEKLEKELEYDIEKAIRKSKSNDIKQYIQMLLKIDKDEVNIAVYSLILSRIEIYENDLLFYNNITNNIDNNTEKKNKIIEVLKTMRLKQDEKDWIYNIFFIEKK
jgi:hypothetical protein